MRLDPSRRHVEPKARRASVEGDQEKESGMEEYFEFLDALRESGATNMFGAGIYLEREYGMDRREARDVLKQWMETYEERHPRG